MKEEQLKIRITIRRATIDEIIGLRHRILRRGLPIKTARWRGDRAKTTEHFGVFLVDSSGMETGEVISCVTFLLGKFYGKTAWQMRGMATAKEHRGKGHASLLLSCAERALLASSPIRLCWCNARVRAVKLYLKHHWIVVSEKFNIPRAGPHRKMIKKLLS